MTLARPPLTLVLEAATSQGSVALVAGDRVLAAASVALRSSTEERLLPAVANVLDAAGARPVDVERIACGAGPGSFTGLRIAGATAKGLAQGLGRPLVALPSLLLVVAGAEPTLPPGGYLVVLDALREERFVAAVDVDDAGRPRAAGAERLVPAAEVARVAGGRTLVGPAEALAHGPHARGAARLGALLDAAVPVALDRWEPDYGRLPAAQVKWEAAHGRPLAAG